MQIWLEPVDFIGTASQSPLCAVLVRVWHHLDKSGFNDEQVVNAINRLSYSAARSFPGNLREYSGNIDADEYAGEVIYNERERLDFPRALSRELEAINQSYGEAIEWCLPIIDPEMALTQVVKFVDGLKGQKWLSIYVISDIDLRAFFGYTRNVVFTSETEFVAMNVMSEALETLRAKTELSLPEPPRPTTTRWDVGLNRVL